VRQFLAGMLSFRMSDRADLERRKARLEAIDYSGEAPDLGAHFSHVLRGLLFWEDGNHVQALASLEKGHVPMSWNQGFGPVVDESINRWVAAEILRESGRLEEALPYYESLVGMNNFPGILYLRPSYLRRAEIYEELGDDPEAIDYYTRLINLWEDADPEVQGFVDQARTGLDRVLDRGTREPTGG